jgi:hypothetical protein
MHKDKRGMMAAIFAACLVVMGAFVVASSQTAVADGPEEYVKYGGGYQFNLRLSERMAPEDIGSTPLIEINNTASVTRYAGPGGDVVIPTVVQYPINNYGDMYGNISEPLSYDVLVVRSIAAGAFQGRTDILSIAIPEGVDSIGAGAFSGCTNLTSLKFLGQVMPGNVSEFWLNGTTPGLCAYSPNLRFTGGYGNGTDFHGLAVYYLPPPSMGDIFDVRPPSYPLMGTITDQNGNPMAKINVAIVGGSNATTDAIGRFVLSAPKGLSSVTISGPSIQQISFKAYLGLGGTELGTIPVELKASSKSSQAEGVALMIGVMAIAMVLLVISVLVSRKRMGEK